MLACIVIYTVGARPIDVVPKDVGGGQLLPEETYVSLVHKVKHRAPLVSIGVLRLLVKLV